MKKQTLEERQAIKELLMKELTPEQLAKVSIMDDTTKFTEVETAKVFTCVEIQLKGCLIENGLRRRYISYADLEKYSVSN